MSKVLLAAATAGLVALTSTPRYQLRVVDETGRTRWSAPVSSATTVTLAYTNSIYGALTEERFAVTPDGFALADVRSTSEAVLAYNGLSAPYRRDGAFLVAAASAHLREIVLRVGQTGQPRLRVGTTDLPLYQAGEGTRLVITVAPSP